MPGGLSAFREWLATGQTPDSHTGMDKGKVEELYAHSQKAYDLELAMDWGPALDAHTSASTQWAEFAKTAKSFSTVDTIYKRIASKRSDLHQQRMNALRPFAKGGQPVPQTILMHPSIKLTMKGLSECVAVAELAGDSQQEQALTLTMHEARSQGESAAALPKYIPSIPGAPLTEYKMERFTKLSVSNLAFELVTVTVSEPTTGSALWILEGWTGTQDYNMGMHEATVYRAAEYPMPAFHLVPHAKGPRNSELYEAYSVSTTVQGVQGFDKPIWEVPDRIGRMWGSSRFEYGGRKFVRKAMDIGKRGYWGDSVHEYTKKTPKPGSKTGKMDDDAMEPALFKFDFKLGLTNKPLSAFAHPGLDPLFKEYLLAVQMLKFATSRYMSGASAPWTTSAEAKRSKAQGEATKTVGGAILASVIALALQG